MRDAFILCLLLLMSANAIEEPSPAASGVEELKNYFTEDGWIIMLADEGSPVRAAKPGDVADAYMQVISAPEGNRREARKRLRVLIEMSDSMSEPSVAQRIVRIACTQDYAGRGYESRMYSPVVSLVEDAGGLELKGSSNISVIYPVLQRALEGLDLETGLSDQAQPVIATAFRYNPQAALSSLYRRPDAEERQRAEILRYHNLAHSVESERVAHSWPPQARPGWQVREAFRQLSEADDPAFRAYAAAVMVGDAAMRDEELLKKAENDPVIFIQLLATTLGDKPAE